MQKDPQHHQYPCYVKRYKRAVRCSSANDWTARGRTFPSRDCYELIPVNSYIETLTPSVTIFGDGAFGRQLGLDGVMRVRSLWWNEWLSKKGRVRSWFLSARWGHSKKVASCLQASERAFTSTEATKVHVGLPSLKNHEKNMSFF